MGDSEAPAAEVRPGTPEVIERGHVELERPKDASKPRKAGAPPAAGPIRPQLTYYFGMRAGLKTLMRDNTVGFDVPEGTRLHIQYDATNSQVETDYARYRRDWLAPSGLGAKEGRDALEDNDKAKDFSKAGTLEWFGMNGTVLSGGDWALVQKNGVVSFEARVTFKTVENFLVDGVFSGMVDLRRVLTPPAGSDNGDLSWVYDTYLTTKPNNTHLPIALAVRFEAADQPHLRPGEDADWITNSRYAAQGRYFWKYQRLVRGQFVGIGSLTLKAEQRSPVAAIALEIYEVGSHLNEGAA